LIPRSGKKPRSKPHLNGGSLQKEGEKLRGRDKLGGGKRKNETCRGISAKKRRKGREKKNIFRDWKSFKGTKKVCVSSGESRRIGEGKRRKGGQGGESSVLVRWGFATGKEGGSAVPIPGIKKGKRNGDKGEASAVFHTPR